MNDLEKIIKIGGLVAIGIFFGFMLWHPLHNDYVSRQTYNALLAENQRLVQENNHLKADVSNLILEFYTRRFAFDLIGINKHRAVFCAVQNHLTGEIPVLSELLC